MKLLKLLFMKKIYFSAIFFGLLNVALGQTGPGGVGNSSNNSIWLDGNVVSLGVNPKIASWLDQSGNGNNFSQAVSGNQPQVVNYSSFSGVRFNGSNWLRTGSGISSLNTNNSSQFIVYNGNKANHVGMLYEGSFTQSNQFYRTYRNNANVRTWVLDNSGGIIDNSTSQSSNFQIISSIWDGDAQTFNGFKDGTLITSKSGANGNPSGNYNNSIGAALNNSYKFNGDMGEVIIYNTTLNSAQKNIVENYLSSKYSISISNDLYSYDVTHKYQVIGIGAESDGNNTTAQGKGIVTISTGSISNGTYILTGHNNTDLSTTTNDVPGTISGGSRISRTWRTGVTGTPGAINIVFDVSTLTLPSGSYYLLVENNNGDFSDGNVTEYGPFADSGGLVTFSSVSLSDGDYFTIASGSNVGIASVKTGNWSSASTWNCSCVPNSSDDITITSGHTVTVSSAITVNNITINGTLNTTQTSTFNVTGNYTIGASGNALHKTITFNGTSNQAITNNSTNTIDFAYLKVNNSSNVGLYTGNFKVTDAVQILDGQLQNISGTFTFISNATKTAVILNSSNGEGFSGEFVVQRFVSQRNDGWGDISSPVLNNHLSDWDCNPSQTARELYMCGVNGFSGSCGGANSVYFYNPLFQSYTAITDTSYVLAPGKAIEMWLADDTTTFYNTTFDSRGTPNYGDVEVAVYDSWNLVGNPYQAWVNWNSLTKPSLYSTYQIWNTNNGSYDAKTSGSIPPHQGFWVESNGESTFTFTEASKNNSALSTFWRTTEDSEPYEFTEGILKIRSDLFYNSHELKLRINKLASIDYDNFDATFKPSFLKETPSITASTIGSTKKLAIVSFNNENEVKIPITINVGIAGKYKIETISFENLISKYNSIILTDTKNNISYNLNQLKQIEVDIELNEEDNRFELKLSNSSQVSTSSDFTPIIYKNSDFTVIEVANDILPYSVSIINAIGQKIIDDFTNVTSTKLLIPNSYLPKGVNIITIKNAKNISVKKLNY